MAQLGSVKTHCWLSLSLCKAKQLLGRGCFGPQLHIIHVTCIFSSTIFLNLTQTSVTMPQNCACSHKVPRKLVCPIMLLLLLNWPGYNFKLTDNGHDTNFHEWPHYFSKRTKRSGQQVMNVQDKNLLQSRLSKHPDAKINFFIYRKTIVIHLILKPVV